MVKTLEKTAAIIHALEESHIATPASLSDRIDIPRSTIHHHLAVLEHQGFVVNEEGEYRLSLRFLDIGERIRKEIPLYEIAQTEIDELAERIKYPVALFVEEHDEAVALYIAGESPSVPITLHAGQSLPLHATAAGKAILCQRSDSEIDEITESGSVNAFTEETITDTEDLWAELKLARERGFAIASEERWRGRSSIAAPIPTDVSSRRAAVELSLSPDELREVDKTELGGVLQQTANVIEIKSDYSR